MDNFTIYRNEFSQNEAEPVRECSSRREEALIFPREKIRASSRRLLQPFGSALSLPVLLLAAGLALTSASTAAEPPGPTRTEWQSVTTGGSLALTVLEPTNPPSDKPLALVVYLKNLAAPRTGTEGDESIIRDFHDAGYLVATLDFGRHPKARVPFLNRDLGKLRDELRAHQLLPQYKIDNAHIYIVPEGCRLERDVMFYRDTARTLAMDIVYPSKPAQPVGAVLEFSCDNQNRMGNASLSICSDTILDAEATEGLAVAMADHPVPPPYKGLDAMPDCAWKIKAAVRTLRAQAGALGLNGRIVPVGFSRGSGMALMLATTEGRKEFEGHGEHPESDSTVQGAVVMSGRFTYLDLLPDDHMLPRYAQVWGPRDASVETWRRHGALDYLEHPALPLFLTINCSEAPDALHQMTVLRKRLGELGNDEVFMMDPEPRGHKVTIVPEILDAMNQYLKARLAPAEPNAVPSVAAIPSAASQRYQIALCDWMNLKRQKLGAFQLTKDIGADGVEVDMGGLGDRETFDNQLVKPEVRQQFLDKARELNLGIPSLAMSGFYAQSFAERPTVPRMVQDCIDTMKLMNVKIAFLPLGVNGDLVKHPELRPVIVERLKAIAPQAEKAGVIIGLETALDAAGDVQLLKDINSPAIRIYFNFANALQNGRDLCAELRTLGKDRICQIHCTDEDGVWLQDNRRLDMPKVKQTLDEMGWSGWLVIERSRDARDPRNVKKNFTANTAYVKSIFQPK